MLTLFCIGEDEDGGAPSDDSVTVIDIVDACRLKEVELDKKGWTGIIKGTYIPFLDHSVYRLLEEC